MIARCARCQQTFPTERFGTQKCPHCGAEIHLADPSAPRPPPAPPPTAPPPSWGAPPPPAGGGWGAAPPAQPPQPPWGSSNAPAGPPSGGPGWGPLAPGAAPSPHDAPDQQSPFADRARIGFLAAWIQTWKLVALEPARFFRLVRSGQSGSAVLFGVLGAWVGSAVSAIFGFFSMSAAMGMMRPFLEKMREQGVDPDALGWMAGAAGGGMAVVQILAAPIAALIGIYLLSALFHLVLLVVKGAPRGFDGTVTVVGYAYGLYVLTALPMCGGLAALVWFLVAAIVGLSEHHRAPTWKGALAVFAPFLVICLCGCGAAVLVPNLLKGLQQAKGGPVSL